MKNTIDFFYFRNWFLNSQYKDNFSIDGLSTLYDYLIDLEEELETEFDFDPIAFCCEYSEYENLADDDLINEFVSFCASQNQYFQKQVFIDAIKKHEQKMRVENVLLSEERIEQTKREIDFLK